MASITGSKWSWTEVIIFKKYLRSQIHMTSYRQCTDFVRDDFQT